MKTTVDGKQLRMPRSHILDELGPPIDLDERKHVVGHLRNFVKEWEFKDFMEMLGLYDPHISEQLPLPAKPVF